MVIGCELVRAHKRTLAQFIPLGFYSGTSLPENMSQAGTEPFSALLCIYQTPPTHLMFPEPTQSTEGAQCQLCVWLWAPPFVGSMA